MNTLDRLVKEIEKIVGIDKKVEVNRTEKNNGITRVGIAIKGNLEKIVPLVYVDEILEGIEKGEVTVEDASKHIVDIRNKYEKAHVTEEQIGDMLTKESVLENVFPVVVNREKNQKLIETVPHTELLDLLVLYRVAVDTGEKGLASAMITNEIAEFAGVSTEELDKAARRNVENQMQIKHMADAMAELGVPEETVEGMKRQNPMYVGSNKNNLNGAAILMFVDKIKELAGYVGGGFIYHSI